jgi:hypothetical protein
MHEDRHGRTPRTRPDARRRPEHGFRLASRPRFAQITADVLATMPEPVAGALRGAEVRHLDVPPPARLEGDDVPLVHIEVSGGRAPRIEVYRRPIEVRALSALDLAELLRDALAHEAADVIGLDLGEEWDDPHH